MTIEKMTPTQQDLSNLSMLLQGLAFAGWTPVEVLCGNDSEAATTSQAVIEKIKKHDIPLLRMVKDGSKTGVMKLEWGQPYKNMIAGMSLSYGFNQAVEQALKKPVQASEIQPQPARDVISVRGTSSCRCNNDDCECPAFDSLAFTINGMHGYGGGQYVQDSPTGSPYFACTFMGWSFKATDPTDAKEQIKKHFQAFKTLQFTEF